MPDTPSPRPAPEERGAAEWALIAEGAASNALLA